MNCLKCKKQLIAVDYPDVGTLYHSEDTEWGIRPDEFGDPGWLVPKSGAKPAIFCGN